MSDYKTAKILECPQRCFKSLDELREYTSRNVAGTCDLEDNAKVDMGYIKPGHGSKGKKVWLCSDSDLKAMYDAHNGK